MEKSSFQRLITGIKNSLQDEYVRFAKKLFCKYRIVYSIYNMRNNRENLEEILRKSFYDTVSLMFRLPASYEMYRCQDTRNEYRDTVSHENRRVNASISVHLYSV